MRLQQRADDCLYEKYKTFDFGEKLHSQDNLVFADDNIGQKIYCNKCLSI